jgi:hypothetical protein
LGTEYQGKHFSPKKKIIHHKSAENYKLQSFIICHHQILEGRSKKYRSIRRVGHADSKGKRNSDKN